VTRIFSWIVGFSVVLSGTSCIAAGTVDCTLTTLRTWYVPDEPWPFSRIQVTGVWWPTCFNFTCLNVPAYIGATAHVDGQVITLELYGSDDALPAGVPRSTSAVVSVPLGPLAPGAYGLQTTVHMVSNGQLSEPCGAAVSSFGPLVIEQATGPVETVAAVEFYNAALDHYFLTSSPQEIADLDAGVHAGWQRTGQQFKVFSPGKSGGVGVPVCRFYGLPSFGLDSHFYTAFAGECAEIPAKFGGAWQLEDPDVFEVRLPATADAFCPTGFDNVYRAWNQRRDSNHRFTTDLAVADQMVGRGYVLEGDGVSGRPVAMCVPH
jgi:hypothetical protein